MGASQATAARKPKPRRFQYSLRTLLLVVCVSGVLIGWVTGTLRHARQQRAAAIAVLKLGASVHDRRRSYTDPSQLPPKTGWREVLLGRDMEIVSVYVFGDK